MGTATAPNGVFGGVFMAYFSSNRSQVQWFWVQRLMVNVQSKRFIHEFLKELRIWETMFQISGFPEHFLKGTKLKYRRWANLYYSQVIRDDIRNEFAVRQIDTMEALYSLITNCVSRPFSASNQANILKISNNTVSLINELNPYTFSRISSALKPCRKKYL